MERRCGTRDICILLDSKTWTRESEGSWVAGRLERPGNVVGGVRNLGRYGEREGVGLAWLVLLCPGCAIWRLDSGKKGLERVIRLRETVSPRR